MDNIDHQMSVQSGYILVEHPQDFEVVLSEQPAMLMKISASCQAADCHKVLILGSQTKVRLSPSDIYDLGQQIAALGLQIAVVESHDASNEDARFLETVTANRGGPIQFFDNQQDAKDWLGVT